MAGAPESCHERVSLLAVATTSTVVIPVTILTDTIIRKIPRPPLSSDSLQRSALPPRGCGFGLRFVGLWVWSCSEFVLGVAVSEVKLPWFASLQALNPSLQIR